ncbi:dicarboxylate transporter/tellurite-resistance protein TehA [Pseudomonas fluorescens]|uniref:dicarboxylate transporter/tellurite-resistance protein TehA n=1 Tax=Pseudomonas fluorescens TaxID=294 RepID=UPI001257DCD5|nr:dicarboxylate transporter/tellurite-resistance protein TehA [Pseudomonas fluorescens]VVN43630.1 Tellurite resistance protein TehA [Pseudomonas fluorescens]
MISAPANSSTSRTLYVVPASAFGIVLGLAGLSKCWRSAQSYWPIYYWVDDLMYLLTSVVWAALIFGYFYKWVKRREIALAELAHPIQCCYIGLLPVSSMLIAVWLYEWCPQVGSRIIYVCACGQLAFSVTRFGGMLRGGRAANATTGVIYLPGVAGNFVSAIALSSIGAIDFGKLFFGAGFFTWMALESILLQRLLIGDALAPDLRPTMGIQLAPPVVGAVAYLAVTGGQVDLFLYSLMGYGIVQLLILARLGSWLAESGFKASLWAFSFGITSLALASLQAGLLSAHSWFTSAAPLFFVLANLFIGCLSILTLRLFVTKRLFRCEIAQDDV